MAILKLGLEMKRDRRNRREVYISPQKLVKLNRACIRRNNLPSWDEENGRKGSA